MNAADLLCRKIWRKKNIPIRKSEAAAGGLNKLLKEYGIAPVKMIEQQEKQMAGKFSSAYSFGYGSYCKAAYPEKPMKTECGLYCFFH